VIEYLLIGIAGLLIGILGTFFILKYKSESEKQQILNQQTENLTRLEQERIYLQKSIEEDLNKIKELEDDLSKKQGLIDELIQTKEELNVRIGKYEKDREGFEERKRDWEEGKAGLLDTFKAIGNDALELNNKQFIALATEYFKQLQIQSVTELNKKEQAIDTLVKPIDEQLKMYREYIEVMDKKRVQDYGSISNLIEEMKKEQQRLVGVTANLVNALKRPQTRGRWGEFALRKVVELSGMTEHCDFEEQVSLNNEEGRLRPDMIINMPQGSIAVDAKTPMLAYLHSVEAENVSDQRKYLEDHARQVKERIKELSSKAYWDKIDPSPQFVVLFIPGEAFYYAAISVDPSLIEYALLNKVLLASPLSLIALLKTIALGWRQEKLAENAEKISEAAKNLYDGLVVFSNHFSGMERSLKGTTDKFNEMVGSLQRNVFPAARKMDELGVKPKEELKDIDPINQLPRTLKLSELPEDKE